jgi:uncharacterized protein YcaQ
VELQDFNLERERTDDRREISAGRAAGSGEAISLESVYREREENGALAAELLALGQDCAGRLKEPWRSADHAEILYNAREVPR